MKNIGIICEYNPFHNGHARQLNFVRAQGNAICLMSGNYVQRGEPALLHKLERAEAAVRAGACLVLELPLTYALRSAEGFADGGVEIFSRLGCFQGLCFGSESGDAGNLMTLAAVLDGPAFSQKLREKLAFGLSFPAARQQAVQELGCNAGALGRPNDILAVEYCKALRKRGCAIEPLVIRREGSYHESTEKNAPSASVLRGQEDWRGYMPEACFAIQHKARKHTLRAGERALLARLRALDAPDFEALPFGSEGLWRKVMRACREENTLLQIIAASKSKRYTHTRLMRMLLCGFLGITEVLLQQEVPYVRVLAMNEQGGGVLRTMREQQDLMLLNSGEKAPSCAFAELERRAEALYGLFAETETEAPVFPAALRYCADSD